MTSVTLRDVATGETWRRDVDGLFVAIGHVPNTKPFMGQIDLDSEGYIISHGGARTNIPGVFHAGDVQDKVYRQAITASARDAWPRSRRSGSSKPKDTDSLLRFGFVLVRQNEPIAVDFKEPYGFVTPWLLGCAVPRVRSDSHSIE